LKTSAELTLVCADERVAGSLASVLAPDNGEVPRGLKVAMRSAGRRLEFKSDAESPSTAISTVLAVLKDAALFQEVWLLSRGKDA